ncbi:MAG: hypothetical protein KC422_05465 [Trueperaceae bacterium]|nr:hypothetical protein [Trueperaceae bacterium]
MRVTPLIKHENLPETELSIDDSSVYTEQSQYLWFKIVSQEKANTHRVEIDLAHIDENVLSK